MPEAKHGDQVSVHYTGKYEDGTVFDSSQEREPVKFKIGERQIIPGFQEAVVGMSPGDSKSVTLQAEQAYGVHNDQLVEEVGRSSLPPDLEVAVGARLNKTDGKGTEVPVTVTHVGEATITIDANHPLAGKNLSFDITLLEVVET